ncbi:MAG: glycosyltransferase family 4 protein, partial [Candidatus Methanofastidiosa archaeon]|nr:glycosyltransferase family 4 protein [Candidatus Methanofastidiosa archaeon]
MKIVFVGISGFPYGRAQINRQYLLALGLAKANCEVTVICRKGVHTKKDGINPNGIVDNIKYFYSSGTTFRPDNSITRNVLKIKGFIVEIRIFYRQNFDIAIVDTKSILILFYYRLFSIMFGFKIILSYVEAFSALNNRKKWFYRINDFLFKKYLHKFIDGLIPISQYLQSSVKNKMIPSFPIPAIVDFNKFNREINEIYSYFCYCSGPGNIDIIKFLIEAFTLVKASDFSLILVTSGRNSEIRAIRSLIDKSEKSDKIILKGYMPYDKLVELLMSSFALLIPMRPILRDIARFPHKIGEYTAAKRPIITTNIGEIRRYFKDGENALVADRYEVDLYAAK